MRRPGALPHRRPSCGAACVLVAFAVTACGVEPQSRPEPVPAERLPSARPEASTAPMSRDRVWGARDGRLVPVFVDVPPQSPAGRVRALLRLSVVRPGQLVPTVTEVPGIVRVTVNAGDAPVALTDPSGRTVSRPLTRDDFSALVAGGLPQTVLRSRR
jgi:hypothetical protein